MKLYLDDERTPPKTFEFTIVRNYADFVGSIIDLFVSQRVLPEMVSFDHDLSENHLLVKNWTEYPKLVEDGHVDLNKFGETGYDVAKWFVGFCREHNLDMCSVNVHSTNPIGATNIAFEINQYYKERGQSLRVTRNIYN